MGTTENTLAVAPALLTVRVLVAGSDEPVKGLFVAFKLAAANALTSVRRDIASLSCECVMSTSPMKAEGRLIRPAHSPT